MTGFTDNERYLGRLVMLAVSKGVTEESFGLGGMRTVGPAVTAQGRDAMIRRYKYLGDKLTDRALINATCAAVLRPDGKCITSQRMSTMLVRFDGESLPRVVLRRMLRKVAND